MINSKVDSKEKVDSEVEDLKLADKMWVLYKQEKSLRKVADIIGGISHDTVRRYLTKAGYDTNSVNPRIINDTQSIQCRIRVEDEQLLRESLDSGYLLGTMSGQILIAVQQYCDRLKVNKAKAQNQNKSA